MSLNDILHDQGADPSIWPLCSVGQWHCVKTKAEVLRETSEKDLKEQRVIYVLVGRERMYGGKTINFRRVRRQLLTKYRDADDAIFIWNRRVLGDEGTQLHIESALTNAFLLSGRPISNRQLGIRAGDVVRLLQARKFLCDVLLDPSSSIRDALGFHEQWALDGIRLVADGLKMSADNYRAYLRGPFTLTATGR